MTLLGSVAVFLLTSMFSLGLSAAFSAGFTPGGAPQPTAVSPVPPVDQTAPRTVEHREVSLPIRGASGPGVLSVPASDGAVPGLVLIAGSGAADEDTMRAEAAEFAKHGIATLTYDKDEDDYTPITRDYAALADDAAAAAHWLSTRPGVDPTRVGVLGFSEGGWVAPLAAARHEGIAFVALASAPVVPPLENAGYTVDQAIAGWPTPLRALPATALSGGRWLCDYLDFDLRTQIDPLTIPVLAVFGADDASIPLDAATTRLRQLAPEARVEILAGTGHHVPVTAGDWVARAAAWMHDPTTFPPGATGATPTQSVGLLQLPQSSWFLHPVLHLALSVTAAIGTGLSIHRARTRPKARP